MKILSIITIVILGALNLCGQINPMDQLFKDKPRNLTLFLNPAFKYSQIALQRAMIGGLGGGVIINKKFSVGVVYSMSINKIPLPVSVGSGKLQMNWGGLLMEYTLWPLQKIHLTFPLSVGAGRLEITGNSSVAAKGNPNFLFAEPGMTIEANIWKYAKLGIGTSYRYVANVNYFSLSQRDLSGFAAVISLKFGMFRYSIRH